MIERKYPEPDKSWWGRKRDDIAFHIATFAFNHIATKWTRCSAPGGESQRANDQPCVVAGSG